MNQHHKLLKWILPLTLLALAANAANIAGKWSGVIAIDDSGGKIETPVELYLEQKAGALSGKIGKRNDPDSVAIRNAKIEGDRVSFESSPTEASGPMAFSLTVHGEEMRGEMRGVAQGNEIVAKVIFSRAK